MPIIYFSWCCFFKIKINVCLFPYPLIDHEWGNTIKVEKIKLKKAALLKNLNGPLIIQSLTLNEQDRNWLIQGQ